MTDSPEFRAWADRDHASSMRLQKQSKNPRYRCSNKSCNNKTTKRQAAKRNHCCMYCGEKLNEGAMKS